MKKTVADLALFGGPAEFVVDGPLHVGKPNVPAEDGTHLGRTKLYALMDTALDSRILTNGGPTVQLFEEKLCEFLGVRHAVAVCNGTVGLQIAIFAVTKRSGTAEWGKVLMPAWTFVAAAHAATWIGGRVEFLDVDRATQNLAMPPAMGEPLHPRLSVTRAVLAPHLWGRPAVVEGQAWGNKMGAGCPVIFDAAHAFGCSYGGRMVGNFGVCEVFSFHATKVVNCFEGGAVTTNDDGLADGLRRLRNFGFAGEDEVSGLGTNGKMSEAHAAMGLVSLDEYPTLVEANVQCFQAYAAGLRRCSVLLQEPFRTQGGAVAKHNFQYVQALVEPQDSGFCRDDLWRVLKAEGVLARRYFHPGVHRMQPYVRWYNADLPNTDYLAARSLVLPSGPQMGGDRVERVCALVRFAVEHGEEVHAGLAKKTAQEAAG